MGALALLRSQAARAGDGLTVRAIDRNRELTYGYFLRGEARRARSRSRCRTRTRITIRVTISLVRERGNPSFGEKRVLDRSIGRA